MPNLNLSSQSTPPDPLTRPVELTPPVPPVVNLAERLGRFSELWAQKRVAGLNGPEGYEIKLAKLKGEFVWYIHDDTDELLMVPRGVEHRTVAAEETAILLLEPAGVLNTGDAGGPMSRAAEPLD